jgi:Macrophage migration inhibitory factor (MIF)
MIVNLRDDATLAFAGTYEPAYHVAIYSIGKITPEMNVNTSAKLAEFFEKELGLPAVRGYITLHDVKGSNWGHNKETFSYL